MEFLNNGSSPVIEEVRNLASSIKWMEKSWLGKQEMSN